MKFEHRKYDDDETRAEFERAQDRVRSGRKRAVRARTISVRSMSRTSEAVGLALYPVTDHHRPLTRGECGNGARPCPYVSCRHNLYLDVMPNGSIKLNFPDLEPDELAESCSLDAAERGGMTLEEVGPLLNMTRERVRQIEAMVRPKLLDGMRELCGFTEEPDATEYDSLESESLAEEMECGYERSKNGE